jgi:hypothetical protein
MEYECLLSLCITDELYKTSRGALSSICSTTSNRSNSAVRRFRAFLNGFNGSKALLERVEYERRQSVSAFES